MHRARPHGIPSASASAIAVIHSLNDVSHCGQCYQGLQGQHRCTYSLPVVGRFGDSNCHRTCLRLLYTLTLAWCGLHHKRSIPDHSRSGREVWKNLSGAGMVGVSPTDNCCASTPFSAFSRLRWSAAETVYQQCVLQLRPTYRSPMMSS